MKNIRTVAAAAALITALSCAGGIAPSASAQVTADNALTLNAEKKTGWVTENGTKYLYDKDGNAYTGLKKVNGKLYYFDSDGAVHTGLLKINGKIYCFTEDGAVTGSTVTVNGKSYTFDENGVLQTAGQAAAETKKSGTTVNFGMTMDEATEILSKKYPVVMPIEDTALLCTSSLDAQSALMYLFDEEGKMQMYLEISQKDRSAAYRKAFEKAGYTAVEVPGGADYGLYFYKGGDRMAIIISTDAVKAFAEDVEGADSVGSGYVVLSGELMKQLEAEGIGFEEEFVKGYAAEFLEN